MDAEVISGSSGGELSPLPFSSLSNRRLFATSLIEWWMVNRRSYPWRRTVPSTPHEQQTHAYQVLVSEIMSQQTRLSVVVPYYNLWMERFPTLSSLANAELESVNAAWSGLGYYRRAHNLHKTAQQLRSGEIPSTVESLMSLPGIGRYTACAVASMVFGVRVGCVDGNVRRVLARVGCIRFVVGSAAAEKTFWRIVDELQLVGARSEEEGPFDEENEEEEEGEMPSELVVDIEDLDDVSSAVSSAFEPGDFNQALMEFGARVCSPRSPKCSSCPIRNLCRARKRVLDGSLKSVEVFPVKKRKRKGREEKYVSCVFYTNASDDVSATFFVRKRPSTGLLAGMNEFPMFRDERNAGMKNVRKIVRENRLLAQPLFHGSVVHVFSHLRWLVDVFSCAVHDPDEFHLAGFWASEDDFGRFGMPSIARKIFETARPAKALTGEKRSRTVQTSLTRFLAPKRRKR